MEIRWSWTTFIFLVIVSQTTMTQNVENDRNKYNSVKSRSSSDEQNERAETLDVRTSNDFDLEELVAKADDFTNKMQKKSKKYKKKPSPSQPQPPIPDDSETPHSRKKRLIWVTEDGRLALPPGTSLTIAPTIALPFVRYPPTGFLSNISISLPVTIDFDKLGLTDNQNPLGVLPPIFARSMGRAAGSMLANYVSDYLKSRRKRSANSFANENFKITTIEDQAPELPDEHKHAFHGGERALLYTVIEDFVANFGLDGKACILRAICEIHSTPVQSFGLIGEMLKLFFTASLSPYSEHLDEYVSAEKIGQGIHGPGECFPYYKDCPKSLFRSKNNYHNNYDNNLDDDTLNEVENNEHFSGINSKDENIIELAANEMSM